MDREKAFKIGSVKVSRAVEIRCVIADLTSRGAKIILDSPETLPPTVTLKISTIGLVRNARVAWQIEREAGLTFRT